MVWCDETQQLTHINNKPIENDKLYNIVVVEIHLKGVDNVIPMVEWSKKNYDLLGEDGIPAKAVLVRYVISIAQKQERKPKENHPIFGIF